MRRRVQNGKKIDTWKFTVDSVAYAVDVYMVPSRYTDRGVTEFVAVADDFDIHVTNSDINALKTEAHKLTAERANVTWAPHLVVTIFSGSYTSWVNESITLQTGLNIKVAEVELATVNGEKRHRVKGHRFTHPGWPETQRRVREPGDDVFQSAFVVEDTPMMRTALEKIHVGIDTLAEQLQRLLNPMDAARVLARIAAGSTPALPLGSKTK